ncbi:DUF5129 domain-containing protein [Actinomyces oris]|nr:DUF5129 domain-containing protein [Actinomyces oris]
MKKPPTVSELGGIRAILGYVGNLLIGVALVMAPFIINGGKSPFYPAKQFHPTVEIHDEAGILHRDQVKSELEKLTFRQATHVVVVNLPNSKVESLQEEVRNYARTHPTDVPWISWEDSGRWADNVMIVAQAPHTDYDDVLAGQGRNFFYGPNLEIDSDGQSAVWYSIQKYLSQSHRDEDALVVTAVNAASSNIGQQFHLIRFLNRVTLFLIFMGLASLWFRYYVARGKKARAGIEEARQAYERVVGRRADMSTFTSLIPVDEPYGVQVVARYMVLQKHYRRLERSWGALGNPVGLQWYGLRVGRQSAYVKAYSMQLNAVQQAVINCARLLSLTEFWRDAWQNECDAVFADMQAVKRFATSGGRAYDLQLTSAMQQVASLRSMVDGLEGRLSQGQLRPVEGLDVLGRVVLELRQIAERFVDGVFAGMSKGERRRCRRRYKKYMNSRSSNPSWKISMMLGGAQIGPGGQEAPGDEGLKPNDRWGGVPRMSSTVRMLTRSPAVDEVAVTGEGVGALSVSTPVMDVYNAYRYAMLYRDPWWKREPSKKRKWAIRWS